MSGRARLLGCLAGLGLLLSCASQGASEAGEEHCRITYRNLGASGDAVWLVAGCEASLAQTSPAAWDDLHTSVAPLLASGATDDNLLAACDRAVGTGIVLALIVDRGERLRTAKRPPIALVEVSSENALTLLFGHDPQLSEPSAVQRRRAGEVIDRRIVDNGLRLLETAALEPFRRELAQEINQEIGEDLVGDVLLLRYTIAEPLGH